jgi:predicted extracellular nuclease
MTRRLEKLSAGIAILAISLALISPVQTARAAAPDLFFSEYVEGGSFNKAVEIYNGTGAAANLSEYVIELYSNGAAAPTQSLTLSVVTASLADGDVLVVAHGSADAAILAVADGTSSAVINFNGDDAFALRHNGSLVDVIGQIGFDPGTQWGAPPVSTLDHTLRRKAAVCQGDSNGGDAFVPSVEWDGFVINTFDGLGAHTANCSGGDLAPDVSSVTPANGAINVSLDSNLEITFNEPVDVTGAWFDIACASSGLHTAAVSGGPSVFTLDPDVDFANGESCTVNIVAAQVTDQDADDPPDGMVSDFSAGFTTVSAASAAALVINEIDYDQPGGDTAEFVEIKNNDSLSVDLDDYDLQLVNGANGGAAEYQLFPLPAVSLAPGDYFVVCANAATVANCDLDVNPNTDLVQNGAPDAVAIRFNGSLVDTVSYEGDMPAPYTEGSGTGLEDPGTAAGINLGISRLPDGADTDQNNIDLSTRCITPGETNSSASSGCQSDVQPTVTSTNPAGGATNVSISNTIDINFSEPVTVGGSWFDIACGSSGAHTAAVSGGPQNYTLDPDTDFAFGESCTVTIIAAGVADQDGTPDNMAADHVFSFSTTAQPFGACFDPATLIHQVQGSGLSSPMNGASGVILEGVVVGDYQAAGQLGGFHLQEQDGDADADPATSEGVWVFNTSFPVNPGDVVRLRGSVTEFSTSGVLLTEILNLTDLTVCSTGASVTPTSVLLPVSHLNDWERYEGMLIHISQELTATENFTLARFGEVALSVDGRLLNPTMIADPGPDAVAQQDLNNRSRILLDDGDNLQNIDPTIHPVGGLSASNTLRSGYTVDSLTGVLEQRFGVYRVQPVGPVAFNADNPRPAVPAVVPGRLRIVAMNVLNYFTTFDTNPGSNNGPNICGPAMSLECRGANNAFEFDRQRTKIINAILALNPDVIGLMEIENNPTASLQDLVDGLNAASAPGTYAFIDTGTIGTDAIKVALIYRPAKVTPAGAYAILDSSVDPTFNDTSNRPVLAQTFEENLTGERFTVAVNHLKSKGSDCNALGDPDLGDGQGNCNLTRTSAAIAQATWLAGDPTGSGDPDFIVIGDLNSYAREDPISALLDAGYTNLIQSFVGAEAYSYVFQGQSGYLDHALSTSTLTSQVSGVTEWHTNTDEPPALDYNEEFKTPGQVTTFYDPAPFRFSDHDPLVVGLNLVPQCNGQNATVYVDHNNKIVGGPFNGQTYHNALAGTSGADVIVGTDGSDTIVAFGGNDLICAGGGNDAVLGGSGNDTVFGGAGKDVIGGGDGADTIDGGAGQDAIEGGLGGDTLAGGGDNDAVLGGPGSDALDGGTGNDLCNGGIGTDTSTACEVKISIP